MSDTLLCVSCYLGEETIALYKVYESLYSPPGKMHPRLLSPQTAKSSTRAALALGCCPRSLVRAGEVWKMVCALCAANMGRQEYLVEIRSAYSPGVGKIQDLNSCFDKLIWFDKLNSSPFSSKEALWVWLSDWGNAEFLQEVPSPSPHTLHPYQIQTEPHHFHPVTKSLTANEST